MSAMTIARDYSLVGPEADRAVAAGLASARWYVPRSLGPNSKDSCGVMTVQQFEIRSSGSRRSSYPGVSAIIFGGPGPRFPLSLTACSTGLRPTAAGTKTCGHRTAFKTQWMNDAVYQIHAHDHARARDLALEPYAPPYRHDNRRPRSRDHHAASAGRCLASTSTSSPSRTRSSSFARCFCTRAAG